jgi:CheY-like chemotaxis protein
MVAMLPEHSLSVRSVFGVGSTFSIELPLTNNPPPRGAAASSKLDDSLPLLAGLYVLLVEDDALVMQATSALFDAHGILYEAYDSYEHFFEQAVKLERIPDVLLSDFRLPNGKTAVDVVQHAHTLFHDIPAIIISGEISDMSELSTLSNTTLLRKPLMPIELLQALVLE